MGKCNDEDFFWGTKGRSCESAAFLHNLVASWARSKGLDVCTVALDVAKFFENISHKDVVSEARATGFPIRLVRCLVVFYGGWRAVSYMGATSEPFKAFGTILPGCSCATGVAKLILKRGLADIARKYSTVKLTSMVDDLVLRTAGPQHTITVQAVQATNSCFELFDGKSLQVSVPKTVFLATAPETVKALTDQTPLTQKNHVEAFRCLGADATTAGKRAAPTCKNRVAEAIKRAVRLRILQKQGARISHVHRASPSTSWLWGTITAGLSPLELHQCRVAAAKAEGRLPLGTSLGMRMAICNADARDPMLMYIAKVVENWCATVWAGSLAQNLLSEVWDNAKDTMAPTDPYSAVVSPAHVVLRVLCFVGWAPLSARVWVTPGGFTTDLLKLAPRTVSRLAVKAARAASDKAAVKAADSRDGGWAAAVDWDPLKRLLRTKSPLTPVHQATLRCLVSNTVWSQERLFRAQRVSTPTCLRCGENPGTLWHHRFQCPATEAQRREWLDHDLLQCAWRVKFLGEKAAETFTRAVLPSPAAVLKQRDYATEGQVKWINPPVAGYITGTVFADGSSLYPAVPELRAAGWALVQVAADGALISAVYGDAPPKECPEQTVADGEDYAACMLARFGCPPMRVFFDCAATVGAINRGQLADRSQHPRAHLWGRYWAAFSGEDVVAYKTKAHTKESDVERGITTHWERRANAHADRYAKLGARLAQQPELNRLRFLALQDVTRRLGIYTAKVQASIAHTDREIATQHAEVPWMTPGSEFLDEEEEPADVEEPVALSNTCPPCTLTDGGVIGYHARGHHVVASTTQDAQRTAFLFCSTCGAYSVARARGLRRQCKGKSDAGKRIQRAQLASLRFPSSASAAIAAPAVTIDQPTSPSLQRIAFLEELTAEPVAVDAAAPVGWLQEGLSHLLTAEALLPAYGLDLESLQREVAKVQARELRRRTGQQDADTWWHDEPPSDDDW